MINVYYFGYCFIILYQFIILNIMRLASWLMMQYQHERYICSKSFAQSSKFFMYIFNKFSLNMEQNPCTMACIVYRVCNKEHLNFLMSPCSLVHYELNKQPMKHAVGMCNTISTINHKGKSEHWGFIDIFMIWSGSSIYFTCFVSIKNKYNLFRIWFLTLLSFIVWQYQL